MNFSHLLQTIPAITPFIGPETIERANGVPFQLRLGANESLFGPSPKALAAMKEATGRTHLYCDPEGYDLRKAIADSNGVRVENISIGAGIDDLLLLLSRAYLNPGDKVVTTLGSYPTFEYAVAGVGGALTKVPYLNDKPDLDGLIGEAKGAKIAYLANPDNPSGHWSTPSGVRAFADALPEETLFILDEAYSDFAPESTNALFPAEDGKTIRVRTFSKGHGMAGSRVGYLIAPAESVAQLNKIRLHFGVNLIAQAAAIASLEDLSHLDYVVKETENQRQTLAKLAESKGLRPLPSKTNFLTIEMASLEAALETVERLKQRQVFIRKPSQPPLDRCIRVSLGRPEDMAIFAEIFEALF